MAIDSISLAAQTIYNKVQSQPQVKTNESLDSYSQNVKFHDMVDVQFNRFSKMTPQQILGHIQGHKNQSVSPPSSAGLVEIATGTIKNSLKKQEQVSRKALINEASLIDVLTATTEATNTMKTVVEVRNKFMEAFDKVMNMSV
jgi:flagellar hook-basal body complex protein FliE